MKRKIWMTTLICSLMYSMTAFAGGFSFDGDRITYVNEDGSRVTGWLQDGDGKWYHFDEDGYASVGWYEENGKRYYFRIGSGSMIADRTITLDGAVYRFDGDGASTRLPDHYVGWMKDDRNWYYRLSDGRFVTDGWKMIDGTWYFFDNEGYMKTGKLERGDAFYYLKEDGAMAREETLTIDGIPYEFDRSGAGTATWPYKPITVIPPEEEKSELNKTLDRMCDQILAGITNAGMTKRQKAEAIYSWIRGHFRYAGNSATRDWVQEAYQGLIRRRGDCYTYFSVSQALLTRCGIQSIEVIRYTDNHHYWNLVNCGDGWYHFDATPRARGGYFCLWTDQQMLTYSAYDDGCFTFDLDLYPRTPLQ